MTVSSSHARAEIPGADSYDWLAALQQNEPWLRKVLYNRVGDRHAVDDLMQEVGLAISRPEIRPRDPHKVGAWLYRVAIRQAYLYRRKMGRYRKLMDAASQQPDVSGPPAPEGDPLRWLLGREYRSAVQDALQRLLDADRDILLLKYGENWTYQQLADRLGVTVHTVEHRLMKAKTRLRKLLNEVQVDTEQ